MEDKKEILEDIRNRIKNWERIFEKILKKLVEISYILKKQYR